MSGYPSPELPSLAELRRLCREVTRTAPEIMLTGHRLLLHDVRPNYIQAGRQVKEHLHSFYEGHILLDGSGVYTIGNEQTVERGGALLHGPHTPHGWEASEIPCLRLLIWFSMEPVVPISRPASWPIWPELLWDVALLLDDANRKQPGWHHRVTSRLTVVLSRLLSIAHWPAGPQPVEPAQIHLIPLTDQFLADNLTRPLTLSDVAAHVGISQRSLCRQFLQLTGATVMERLANLRMDRAAELLVETDAPLQEIGLQIGMPEPSYFCRRFRKHFHVTPQTYRRQIAHQQTQPETVS